MSRNPSHFISDRRGAREASWGGEADWATGTAENVAVVDGVLVGQAPTQSRQISGDVELYNEGANEDNWRYGGTEGDPNTPLGGTLTKETDHLFADADPNPDGFNAVSWVYDDVIDFGGYREIVVESASQENEGFVAVVLSTKKYVDIEEFYRTGGSDNHSGPYPRKTETLDVSDVSNEYYVHLMARDNVISSDGYDDSRRSEAEFYYVGLNI
ncbi:hypothetical protein [Halorubrum sp. AJ67]|uniref:hypothetical protein n=1 Tax=Halorubrum sp. AJ67 TaxID=1173487 RepID=UPI0012AC0779|nr:hypothetical protein [Halorubrum sp. AJ67]